MIKYLKIKLLISMFLLVTVFSVTSSCFASISIEVKNFKKYDGPDVQSIINYIESTKNVDLENCIILVDYSMSSMSYYYEFFKFADVLPVALKPKTSNDEVIYNFYDNNNNLIISKNYLHYSFYFNDNTFSFDNCYLSENHSIVANKRVYYYFYDNCSIDIYDLSGNKVHNAYKAIPSLNYNIVGVSRNELRLTVNNFASDYNVYGYTSDVNYSVGDTLDVSSNTSYLRLFRAYSNEVDFSCIIRPTEKIYYYIVDSNNKVVSTGVISELSSGYFLYGFPVDGGVDFVFLLDGKEYWNNAFSFKYIIEGDSNEYLNNDIVNLGTYSRIPVSNNVASRNFTGKVYNNNNEVIATATAVATNDLSSFTCDVQTNYFENHIGWNKFCFFISGFNFTGWNSDGSQIDFSNFYVKWFVDSSIVLQDIFVNDVKYSTRSGVISGCSSSGFLSANVEFDILEKNYRSFDINYDVYNGKNELVYSGKINSNNIAQREIDDVSNNVDKPDYSIFDNENYTPGNGSGLDVDNIKNWKIEDYKKFIGTDNFIWTFFKAILGNLPWWITTPLTILIFGVVIITLLRLIRGA